MNDRRTIEKPWGYEEILEQNDAYVLKRLFMKPCECCSLQYHNFKTETIYVISGTLAVISGDGTTRYLVPGDHVTIIPKEIHRMFAMTGCIYLESSTNHLDDVVRLKDVYGRGLANESSDTNERLGNETRESN